MRVLVVYASRHGATHQMAERIAATIGHRAIDVEVKSVDATIDLTGWDAVVVGSAVYATHWLKEATEFIRRNRAVLASKPVWLFSSGPLGSSTTDDKGGDVTVAARPREYAELRDAIHPREHRVFFGAFDPASRPIGMMERVARVLPAGRAMLPDGDFRDWDEIEGWAGRIADHLRLESAGVH
jgi:menaquinone-dependent protoporphyrinogen oxidase